MPEKTFERITDDNLFEFSQCCATSYCKKYGKWSQYDDATMEAALFLLKRRDRWPTLDVAQWRTRTTLALIRWFQQSVKLRNKYRLRERVALERVEGRSNADLDAYEQREYDLSLIRRAASNAGCLDCLDAITAIVNGESIKVVAKRYQLSYGSTRSIYDRFLFELKKIGANNNGVSIESNIVSTDETPLFNFANSESIQEFS